MTKYGVPAKVVSIVTDLISPNGRCALYRKYVPDSLTSLAAVRIFRVEKREREREGRIS